jgi:hypothetical protein
MPHKVGKRKVEGRAEREKKKEGETTVADILGVFLEYQTPF